MAGSQNRDRIGERTETLQSQKAGIHYAVVDALSRIRFTEVKIGKIWDSNLGRVFDTAAVSPS
ncbi:hypothetical protein [Spirosoma spitsbergense]|uniref:hypothetical protein n=1 Tax=Spirosoma spitsbergense TaxID=431554 RepID=UPI0004758346|nr:hypothetical protein [Spirosoma spitsbergense]